MEILRKRIERKIARARKVESTRLTERRELRKYLDGLQVALMCVEVRIDEINKGSDS